MTVHPASVPVLVGLWLTLASLLAFAAMGVDKRLARADGRRIRERQLLVAALAGGLPGVALGMVAFRHKTQKTRFKLALVGVAVVHAVVGLWLAGVVSCDPRVLPRLC